MKGEYDLSRCQAFSPLALPVIIVFDYKTNKRYDYYNNHLTTKRFNRLMRSEIKCNVQKLKTENILLQ